jgi:hypothetical protein
LTVAEAAKVLGMPAAPGYSAAAGHQCFWPSASGAMPFVSVEIVWKVLYDGAANTVPRGVTKTPVDGIGDEAFLKTSGPTRLLYFRQGTTYVKVLVTVKLGAPDDDTAEQRAARLILPKLR